MKAQILNVELRETESGNPYKVVRFIDASNPFDTRTFVRTLFAREKQDGTFSFGAAETIEKFIGKSIDGCSIFDGQLPIARTFEGRDGQTITTNRFVTVLLPHETAQDDETRMKTILKLAKVTVDTTAEVAEATAGNELRS